MALPAIALGAVAALCVYAGVRLLAAAHGYGAEAVALTLLIALLSLTALALSALILRRKRKDGVPAVRSRLLFPLIAVLALSFSLFLPPLSGPDESTHYATVYRYSNILLGLANPNEAPRTKSMGLVRYDTLYRAEDAKLMNAYTAYEPTWEGLYAPAYGDFTLHSDAGETAVDAHDAAPYAIIGYIPAILGLSVGRLLRLSAVAAAFLARFCNLLVSAWLIAYSVRKCRLAPRVLLVTALFPMTLHLIGTLSPDGLWIAVSFAAYAAFSRLCAAEHRLGVMNTLPFALLTALAALMKGVSAPLCLIVLLPGTARFASKRDYFLSAALAVCFSLAALLIANGAAIGAAISGAGAYRGDAILLSDVLSSPMAYIAMFFRSVMHDIPMLALTMVGYSLGAFNVFLPSYAYAAGYLALALLSAVPAGDDESVQLSGRAFLIPAALLTLLPAYGSMLLWWTPKESSRILGVQGRYFLPMLPIGLAAFTGLKARLTPLSDVLTAALFGLSAAAVPMTALKLFLSFA